MSKKGRIWNWDLDPERFFGKMNTVKKFWLRPVLKPHHYVIGYQEEDKMSSRSGHLDAEERRKGISYRISRGGQNVIQKWSP
jgi:hypothetical protein